jgi:hypothetical protein
MDYGEVAMGSLAMDHMGSASPDMTNSNVQSPMAGYDMQMPSGLGIDAQEYSAQLHTVAGINNSSSSNSSRRISQQQSMGQGHGMAAPRSIPTGVDWEVFADQWGHGPKHPVPENRMPQDRYDSKYSFIMEDGFGRRRRGD